MTDQSHDSEIEGLFERFLEEHPKDADQAFEGFLREHAAHADRLRALHSDWKALASLRGRADVGGATSAPITADDGSVSAPDWKSTTTHELLDKLGVHSAHGARYVQRDVIGAGGMGEVREVWDDDLRRTLAMKTIKPNLLSARRGDEDSDEHLLHRFFEEAQITAQLGHPGIVPVHEVGVDSRGRPFFTMTRVRGENLGAIYARLRAGDAEWTLTRVLGVLQRVCETMAFAHSRGVVHRDLKPANVMAGEFGEVYVMDWGLARVLRGEQTDVAPERVNTDRQRAIDSDPATPLATLGLRQPGTVFYMSPEQAAGRAADIGPRSDVYSIGAMLYELLTGRVPYKQDGERQNHDDVRRAVLAGPPQRVEELAPGQPPELVAICEKAMARSAEHRYGEMRAMAHDLRAFLENRVVRAHRTGAWVEFRKWVRRNQLAATAIVTGLVLVVSVSAGANVVVAGKNEDLQTQYERANTEKVRAESASAEAQRNATAAEAARQESQTRLAESFVRTAELVGQRGRWREALDALAEARAAGFADLVLLELRESEALHAVGERDAARAKLEALGARDDLGSRRASVLIARADLLMADDQQFEAASKLLNEALELGLAPADAEFARALLCQDLACALEHVQKAIAHDPFHHRALTTEMTLFCFSGRLDEALTAAEGVARVYPEDPDPIALRAFVFALRGEGEKARAECERVRASLAKGAFEVLDASVGLCAKLHSAVFAAAASGLATNPAIPELESVLKGFGKAFKRRDANRVEWENLEMVRPSLPVLRRGVYAAFRAVQKFALASWYGNAKVLAELRDAAETMPEPMILFLIGNMEMLEPGATPEEMIQTIRRAEGYYRRASEGPSMIPGVESVSLYWAAYAQAIAGKSTKFGEDPEMLARLAKSVDRLVDDPLTVPAQCRILIGEMTRRGIDPLLSERLLRKLEALAPDAPGDRGYVAQIAVQRGEFGRALALLDELLATAPADETLAKLRERALADFRAVEERVNATNVTGAK